MSIVTVLLSLCLASCLAEPANIYLGYQDSLGQYSYGYSAPGSAKSELRTASGAIRGSYSYVDANGAIQSAEYVADEGGFRVAATNLPQAPFPVAYTPEVAAARAEHLRAQELAKKADEDLESSIQQSGAEKEQKADEKIEIAAARLALPIEKPMKEMMEKEPMKEMIKPEPMPMKPLPIPMTLPMFRVGQGSMSVQPPEPLSSNFAQGSSSITPSSTFLKSGGEKGQERVVARQAILPQILEKRKPAIAPIYTGHYYSGAYHVLPLGYPYSNLITYSLL